MDRVEHGGSAGNQPSWQAEILALACTQIGLPLLNSRNLVLTKVVGAVEWLCSCCRLRNLFIADEVDLLLVSSPFMVA